ncbi:MAG TPA: thiamine pyrophosphate-dependent enzyme [Candidatus Pacearchaeota archaeon]|nr:thiamine pyrophosphate-dependent enzyme [Candidatus Pacearchaeota archaeon]
MKTLNRNLRKRIIEKGYENNMWGYGSAFSCLDAIKYLYDEVLNQKDTFILSKGHGAMALYAVLESKGKKPVWMEHPELDEKNGIYATSGSLGHGLPIAIGRAFAKKIKETESIVYVLTGDGEMQEGSNWEALGIASSLHLNVTLLVDCNKYGSLEKLKGDTKTDNKSLEKKIKTFGFKTKKINGHNIKSLRKIKREEGCNAILLDTIKGKGISILEKDSPHSYIWKNEKECSKYLEELK